MIKTVIVLALFSLGMITGVKAVDQIEISRFQGERITGIEVGGAFEIKLRQGENTGVVLNIPARYENQLTVSLDEGGKLKIGFKGAIKGGRNNDRYLAEIVCSSLEDIKLSGACSLNGEGDFYGERLSIGLSGAATAVVGGYIEVVEKVKVGLSGAAHFTGNLSVPVVDAILSGASCLTLHGNADSGKIEISGATQAHMKDFAFRRLSASASGASCLKIQGNEELNISGSGASKIYYRGSGRLNLHTSGACIVRQF